MAKNPARFVLLFLGLFVISILLSRPEGEMLVGTFWAILFIIASFPIVYLPLIIMNRFFRNDIGKVLLLFLVSLIYYNVMFNILDHGWISQELIDRVISEGAQFRDALFFFHISLLWSLVLTTLIFEIKT